MKADVAHVESHGQLRRFQTRGRDLRPDGRQVRLVEAIGLNADHDNARVPFNDGSCRIWHETLL